MTLIYQSPALANVVFEAITNNVSPETTAYRVAVAYVTREGARTLVNALAEKAGDGWGEVPKTVVTCFDFGTTEPSALDYLLAQGFEVRIANLGADGTIRLMANPCSFHPKVYLAPASGVVRAVVGSANLSRRALSVNTEAIATMELTEQEVAALWGEIVLNSVELTDELLQSYRDARPQQRGAPRTDEPPVPPPTDPGALPVFRNAVESGEVDPYEHQAFWVEVGGPSGGSGNQLELPRRSQRFFGFNFDAYDEDHHVIGEPTLTTRTGSWDCRLTWHGNNGMERINLPTTAKSGLTYAHRIVLFQRSGTSFEITVAAPDSVRAARWREESAASSTLYRFSAGSNRTCGLI